MKKFLFGLSTGLVVCKLGKSQSVKRYVRAKRDQFIAHAVEAYVQEMTKQTTNHYKVTS